MASLFEFVCDLLLTGCHHPRSPAWYRYFGLDPNEILPWCFRHRYASVFILDRLPVRLNGLRFEDDALAGFVEDRLARDYGALGYEIVRVPVLEPDERWTPCSPVPGADSLPAPAEASRRALRESAMHTRRLPDFPDCCSPVRGRDPPPHGKRVPGVSRPARRGGRRSGRAPA
jgi:hypothetical protein